MILSVIVIGNKTNLEIKDNIEIKYTNGLDIKNIAISCKGKYIVFVKEGDTLNDNYLDIILNKINNTSFDSC